MTSLQYVENILEDNWNSSITGRPHDVGKIGEQIKVVYESDDDWRRMNLGAYDYITLTDGGIANYEPQSFGWDHEDADAVVTIDIRSKGWPQQERPGRIALYGERGAGDLDDNEAPRHGGLAGEAVRCIKSVRRGDQEWSLINASEVNDLSGQMGGGIWRATVTVRLEARSSTIDTST